jgi:hypothetical protein
MASEIEQKNKQRSTKYTHKNKDRVTRTPLKNRRITQVLRQGRQWTEHHQYNIIECQIKGFSLHILFLL